jgi:hypothetical protein
MTLISVRLVVRGDGEDGVPMPRLRAEISPSAEAAAYAIDPERHLSPTPATRIDDVDGVGDRSGILSMA